MVIRKLINLIQFKVDETQLKNSKKKIADFKKGMKLAGLAVSAGIIAIGIAAVKTAADMESLGAEFEVMLGSAEKSKTLVEGLIDFAAKTPFQVQGLSENARTLLQFGFSVEELLPTLRMLGDVAGKNSQKFQSLTFALGKVNSQGKLTGMELKQMIIAGFNPLNFIAQKTGESMMALRKRMSRGAIGAAEVAGAFKVATSEGGMFFKNMEKQSLTFGGLVSTMKDNISLLLADFGFIVLPILKKIVTGITNVVQKFRTMSPTIKKVIIVIALLLAIVTPLIIAIGAVTSAMVTLNAVLIANPIGLIIMGIAALVAALIFLWFNVDRIINWFKRLWTEGGKLRKIFLLIAAWVFLPITMLILLIKFIKKVVENFDTIKIVAKAVFNIVKRIMKSFLKSAVAPWIFTFKKIFKLFKKLKKIAKEFIWDNLVKGFKFVLKILKKIASALADKLEPVFTKLGEIFEKITTTLQDVLRTILLKVFGVVNKVIRTVNTLIKEISFIVRKEIALLTPVNIAQIEKDIAPAPKGPTNITTSIQTNFNGVNPNDREGVRRAVERSAGTVFHLELKKLLTSAGGL